MEDNIIESPKAVSAGEFFGTLMQSVVESWGYHLKTESYAEHIALNEFYDEMIELVDELIEDYQGSFGKIDNFVFDSFEITSDTAYGYMTELKEFMKTNRNFFENDSELMSDSDAILSLIDKTMYKLKELK